MQQIFEASLGLLEDVGMADAVPEFVAAVTSAGGRLDDEGRLRYPRSVVEGAIEVAAKSWVWHGIDEDRSIELNDNNVHFGTAGAAVLVLEHDTQTFRRSTAMDLYNFARLADTLDNIHFFGRTVVATELADLHELDLTTAYVAMMGTTKPIATSFFRREHVYEAVEMFDMVLGGPGEYRKRPFVCSLSTFVVPPLRFVIDTTSAMVAQIETGMPIHLISAGQAGATSPASLAGALVQALAECLAVLTSVNLLSPGHPCVMGMWPFVSDLRTGAMSGGSGEEAALSAAGSQIINWLGLPSGVPAGMADSKIPDAQAGHEKGLTVGLAAQAGSNLVFESAGMLGSLLVCSPEMMVIDNDLLGAANRSLRGIDVSDDALSVDVIKDVISGAGHFLGHPQTLRLMERDYVYPAVGDRLSPDDWMDAGALSAADRAHSCVEKTLATHFPRHVSTEVDDAIRARFPIMLSAESVRGAID
jgi:trimethylamine--corrinoid protein Co-methyltransferase